MPSIVLILVAVIVQIHLSSAADVNYVKSNDNLPCPAKPCFTLNQWQSSNFTSGSVFFFLAGNHSLSTPVYITNVSNITFSSAENGNSDTSVAISSNESALTFVNVKNFTIEKLKFVVNSAIAASSSVFRFIDCDEIHLVNSTVLGNSVMRALYLENSPAKIETCLFKDNYAVSNGGAIYAHLRVKLEITDTIFMANTASHEFGSGGALYALHGFSVKIYGSHFLYNAGYSGAIDVASILNVTIVDSNFVGNYASNGGGAISMDDVTMTLHGTERQPCDEPSDPPRQCNSDYDTILNRVAPLGCHFCDNRASIGGAIKAGFDSNLLFSGAAIFFVNNSASSQGGAVYMLGAQATMSASHISFVGNRARNGGGVSMERSQLTLTDLETSSAVVEFVNNIAEQFGGGVYIYHSDVITDSEATSLRLRGNTALYGGGVSITNDRSMSRFKTVEMSGVFVGNTGTKCGAAVFIESVKASINLENVAIKFNAGSSALCIRDSEGVTFSGNTTLLGNTGSLGGAVNSKNSSIRFEGHCVFANNSVTNGHGGAIYSQRDTLDFNGTVTVSHNMADYDGGGLYIISSAVVFNDKAYFSSNAARNGGAMYFMGTPTLHIQFSLTTSHNYAREHGGAIYHQDSPTPLQCNFDPENSNNESYPTDKIAELPQCFLKLKVGTFLTSDATYFYPQATVYSNYDSSKKPGKFLYGGLLDRCFMDYVSIYKSGRKSVFYLPFDLLKTFVFNSTTSHDKTSEISSQPYGITFCDKDREASSRVMRGIQVYRGQKFNVSVQAKVQGRIATSATVAAMVSNTSRLELGQNLQFLSQNCSNLTYSVYSIKGSETITISPEGLCFNTGVCRAVIEVTLLPCPKGFSLSTDHCVCEGRLRRYNVTCVIDEDVYLTRQQGSRFWMQTLYDNGSYQGLVIYKWCPFQYCKEGRVEISLEFPDSQCDDNRSGTLCGACAANYSLMFGSSKCGICSNVYLSLLLPFALAGIALVVFLSFLRLTVATGMINSVILYANVVQANNHVFFPLHKRNVLTVFIAWMNLDLGFETCFFDGMDAYAQTWLQFVFPLYVWLLISVIIITSRYSFTISKVIGHNPIAVLATLMLMSYTKLLKSFIVVYSFANLNFPNNETVRVWLKDSNVLYFEPKHLILMVVTTLILAFVLPYTVLLLLGYKLYRFTNKKPFRWLNRIKPLMDSYYAPYNSHTRYWTGFLLLLRCFLYSVFAFHCAVCTSLAITISFAAVTAIWVFGRIYEKPLTNVIEISVYLNLIILSATAGANVSSQPLVLSLVGIVFATMIAIILYHFHLHYISKYDLFKRVKVWVRANVSNHQPSTSDAEEEAKPVETSFCKNLSDFREPLLDNSF